MKIEIKENQRSAESSTIQNEKAPSPQRTNRKSKYKTEDKHSVYISLAEKPTKE